MLVLKKAIYFLVWLLVFDPSSAFLTDPCNIQFDPTKLFDKNTEFEPTDVLKGAACVGSILKANRNLIVKFPTIHKFIENLLQSGTSAITQNPGYVVASVYFSGLLIVSHVYAIDAKNQLIQAQFEQDDLNIAIDAEIIPILKFIESVLIKEGAKNGMKNVCSTNFLEEMIDAAVRDIKVVRKNVEKKMLDSERGKENNGFFQKLSAGGVVAGALAVAAAPCPFTAFLICPPLMAGAAGVASGGAGYYLFGSNKQTHQQTFDLLSQARRNAMVVEEALRRALVHIRFACQYKMYGVKELE